MPGSRQGGQPGFQVNAVVLGDVTAALADVGMAQDKGAALS